MESSRIRIPNVKVISPSKACFSKKVGFDTDNTLMMAPMTNDHSMYRNIPLITGSKTERISFVIRELIAI